VSESISVSAVRAYRVEVALEEAYQLAYATFETIGNLVVRVETESGLVGWGSASPDPHVTGESVEGNLDALREVLVPALRRSRGSSVEQHLGAIAEAVPENPASRAAVDLALHDLWGKERAASIRSVLGGTGSEIPTSITIGIMNSEETLAAAAERLAQGFHVLKIKGGRDPDEDVTRIRALRKVHGSGVRIRLDANQGYSVEQARSVMRALAGKIQFLEQPVAAADLEGLAALAAEATLPVMADEPVLGPREAEAVLDRGLRLVCVKLMKSGGLAPAVKVCNLAQRRGARVMVGCMDELPISMAGAAHLALSHPAVAYADLDGHIGMVQEFVTGGLEIREGRVSVGAAPGLGVRVDEDRLDEFQVL
jgi:L-alanine-DL-glutamate epimerase-like enolase superfamily enzyme